MMNCKLLYIVPVIIFSICGCGILSEYQSLIIDEQIEGPMGQIPVHITTKRTTPTLTISPHFSAPIQRSAVNMVEGSDPKVTKKIFSSETITDMKGKTIQLNDDRNLYWSFPRSMTGLEMEAAQRSTAVSFGGSYSQTASTSLMGFYGTAGIFKVDSSGKGLRIETGITFNELFHRTTSITSKPNGNYDIAKTKFDVLTETSVHFGYLFSVTLNTGGNHRSTNYFIQFAFSRQNLFDYNSQSMEWDIISANTTSIATDKSFLSIAPGIYNMIGENIRIVSGARFLYMINENENHTSYFIIPFVRCDIVFSNIRPMQSN